MDDRGLRGGSSRSPARHQGFSDVWGGGGPFRTRRGLSAALRDFGAPLAGLDVADFSVPGIGLQFGRPPLRVDILTAISGLAFAEAWPRAIVETIDDVPGRFIALDDLLTNKRAAGRPQDVADVAALERIRRRSP